MKSNKYSPGELISLSHMFYFTPNDSYLHSNGMAFRALLLGMDNF